jgi:hypothetical protein
MRFANNGSLSLDKSAQAMEDQPSLVAPGNALEAEMKYSMTEAERSNVVQGVLNGTPISLLLWTALFMVMR